MNGWVSILERLILLRPLEALTLGIRLRVRMVQPAAGAAGADGATITAVAWDGNDMKFTDSKSATFKLTNAKVDLKGAGADGIDGADGADFDPAVYISVSDVSNTFTCNVNSKRNVNFA